MKFIIFIVGLGALILTFGCAGNLPPGAKRVGGGLRITWWAPADGTAILVETTTGKTVATETMTQGGPQFSFDASSEHDAQTLTTLFPSMPTNAQFALYFVPAPKKN